MNNEAKTITVGGRDYTYSVKCDKHMNGILHYYNVALGPEVNTVAVLSSIVREVVRETVDGDKKTLYMDYPSGRSERKITHEGDSVKFSTIKPAYHGNVFNYKSFSIKVQNISVVFEK